MGSSSSVRFFSSLAQSRSSAQLEHRHTSGEESELEQADPETLLRECEEVLRKRPPRPHRDFIRTRASAAHNPQIRVMQWNILAQGTAPSPRPPLNPAQLCSESGSPEIT